MFGFRSLIRRGLVDEAELQIDEPGEQVAPLDGIKTAITQMRHQIRQNISYI